MTHDVDRLAAVHRVLEALDPSVAVDPAFPAFATAVLERVRGPYLADTPARLVVRDLEAAFRFVAPRPAGTPGAVVRPVHEGRGVVVLTHVDDQPFLVDTVRLFLRRAACDWWTGFHVVVDVRRDAEGRLVGVGEGRPESVILVHASAGSLPEDAEAPARLVHALTLAQAAVRDFAAMRAAVEAFVARCDARAAAGGAEAAGFAETGDLLRWLLRDSFVFLGVRGPGGALGVETVEGPYAGRADGPWPAPHAPGTVRVRKSSVRSPIHREGRIDEVLVSLDGADLASSLLVRGLFTFRAVSQPSREVPVLRGVLQRLLDERGAVEGSFRYKGLANVFDALPTEILFGTPPEAIGRIVEHVLDAETAQEVGVTVVRHPDASALCLVSMPRSSYAEEVRGAVEADVVATLRPTWWDQGLYVGRHDTALLHVNLAGIALLDDAAVHAMEERLRAHATPWTHRLWEALSGAVGAERADELVETWGRSFPATYTRETPVGRAVVDLGHLAALSPERPISASLLEEGDGLILTLYQHDDVSLTRLLPVIDHLGLTVRSSSAVEVAVGGRRHTLDRFLLDVDPTLRAALLAQRERLVEALPAVLGDRVDDDPFNALVVSAGLAWHEVDVIRAYGRYMRQLQVQVSQPQLQSMVLSRPEIVASVHALFRARFDPALPGPRDAAVGVAREALEGLLRTLQTHDEDIVFGGLANLVLATVRTNAYRRERLAERGRALALKLDGRLVRDMKGNRPLYEIYVHAPEVEGVHLRFGKVARGGLRWSDRADYRTEVLALVTTQQIKNVVIVPEGAKGGFFLRRPGKPEQRRAQADAAYRVYVRALLDVTDDQRDGRVVGPPDVVRHDGDDPYLVVAADKGTAHLSDTANELSEAAGFWLGDAFASGGSNGYDHKKVGITARGAWVLVKRHFAELGRDPYTEPFTCVGIGDMGGDVFGNGLLESRTTRLVAAFNHAHVFLDPSPDPEASFRERERLFRSGGREGGWDRYDRSRISSGGGVWDRSAKTLPLAPEARALLGLDVPEASPEEVVRAILRLPVDLLWSGGIGTYVKASDETHAEVDDRGNDRFRVDASELRCRVVGEGANLSFTQAARVEAARRGVRLNADFVDNSGGVDLSDHEVNLKILLQRPVTRGDLTTATRNALLRELTDEVSALVLRDNDVQGRQLSRDRLRSERDLAPFGRAIAFVERVFGIPRSRLGLPSESELTVRTREGAGLTRPELAMLAAHVKRWVYAELLASGRARALDADRAMLRGYFPSAVRERFVSDIDAHPLADEITMTLVTTRVVGDAGAAFVPLAVEATGRSVADVAEAYLKAQRLAEADATRSALEQLRANVAMPALTAAWLEVDGGCRDVVAFWLAPGGRPPTDAELAEMLPSVDEVVATDAEEVHRRNAAAISAMRDQGIPEAVARLVVRARYLDAALMVGWQARRAGASLHDTAVTQRAALRASRLQEVIESAGSRPGAGRWEPVAVQVVAHRLGRLARELVLRLGVRPGTSVDALEPELREGVLAGVRAQVDQLLTPGEAPDLATLTVLAERLEGAVRRLPGATP